MVQIDLVSACSNGGYHCEFAGGGLPLPNYTYQKFEELRQAQNSGTGITLNTLYANPYLWGFQYPIVCELRYARSELRLSLVSPLSPHPHEWLALLANACGLQQKGHSDRVTDHWRRSPDRRESDRDLRRYVPPSLSISHLLDVLQLYLPLKRSSSHVATVMLVAHAY